MPDVFTLVGIKALNMSAVSSRYFSRQLQRIEQPSNRPISALNVLLEIGSYCRCLINYIVEAVWYAACRAGLMELPADN